MHFHPKRFHLPKLGWNFHTLAPAVLFLLYLPVSLTGGPEATFSDAYRNFGLHLSGIREGNFWSLLSHSLLHGNWAHWLTNSFFLFYFGGRIHDIFGEKQVWQTAFFATLAGAVCHLIFQGSGLLVGSSAAAMGLFVAVTTVSPESRMFPFRLRARNLRHGIIIASLFFLLITPTLGLPIFSRLGNLVVHWGGGALFDFGHAYHLGGALAGSLTMRKYFRKPVTLAQLREERAAREENSNEAA